LNPRLFWRKTSNLPPHPTRSRENHLTCCC